MRKKETKVLKKEQPITSEKERPLPHFYGDYYDRFGVRRNTTCRGCPFDGQFTTCLED